MRHPPGSRAGSWSIRFRGALREVPPTPRHCGRGSCVLWAEFTSRGAKDARGTTRATGRPRRNKEPKPRPARRPGRANSYGLPFAASEEASTLTAGARLHRLRPAAGERRSDERSMQGLYRSGRPSAAGIPRGPPTESASLRVPFLPTAIRRGHRVGGHRLPSLRNQFTAPPRMPVMPQASGQSPPGHLDVFPLPRSQNGGPFGSRFWGDSERPFA